MVQKAEYDWPTPKGGPRFNPEHPVTKLEGDRDVFGDGSVTILSTPGHTPGHQSLLVKLPKTGAVLLSRRRRPFQGELGWQGRAQHQLRQGKDCLVDGPDGRCAGAEQGRDLDQPRQAAERFAQAVAAVLRLTKKSGAGGCVPCWEQPVRARSGGDDRDVYFGMMPGSPPGVPGGGMTGVTPPPTGGAEMPGSMPAGGQYDPLRARELIAEIGAAGCLSWRGRSRCAALALRAEWRRPERRHRRLRLREGERDAAGPERQQGGRETQGIACVPLSDMCQLNVETIGPVPRATCVGIAARAAGRSGVGEIAVAVVPISRQRRPLR